MNRVNTHKFGLVLGTCAGLVHLVWSVLIALGLADKYLNFVLSMHSLNNPYVVAGFDLMRSVELVVITAIVGYIVGTVFGHIWNWVTKN